MRAFMVVPFVKGDHASREGLAVSSPVSGSRINERGFEESEPGRARYRLQRSSDSDDYTGMKPHLLIGTKGCGNVIVECALALAAVPYEYEEVDYSEGSATRPRLLEVNPLGQVPTLVLPDGWVMGESLAMIHYLDGLAPAAGLVPARGDPARVPFLRWSTFVVAAVYPTFTYGDEPEKWVPNAEGAKQLRASTDRHRETLWKQLEGAAGSPWFLGGKRSALDLYLMVMTHWRPRRAWFDANAPRIAAIADKVAAIPELGPILEKNFGS
jgi:GST-like protein